MNRINKNIRWFLISNIENQENIHESKPFLFYSYNSLINPLVKPEFSQFNEFNSIFSPFKKIKIVRNLKESETSGDITHNDLHYKYVTTSLNFDTFDNVISNIEKDDNIFYYLYLETYVNLTNVYFDKINQFCVGVIKTKDGNPYKYDQFDAGYATKKCDNTFDVIKLTLDHQTPLNVVKSSDIEQNPTWFKQGIII